MAADTLTGLGFKHNYACCNLSMQSFMTSAAITSCSIVQPKDGFVHSNAALHTAAVICITRGA